MNEFKILSIDELDKEFVTKLRVPVTVEPKKVESLIPEMVNSQVVYSEREQKNEVPENIVQNNIINDYLSSDPRPVNYDPQNDGNGPRPIVPLGQGKAFYAPADAELNNNFNTPVEQNVKSSKAAKKAKKGKSSKGMLAGKIICVIMLVVTLLVFIGGCFISIFLNNDGVDLNGICFNTLATDTKLSKEELKEGDLIISKKADFDELKDSLNKPIALPVEGVDNDGCKIEYIYSVSNIIEDEASILTYNPETKEISAEKQVGDLTYGIVTGYVPFIGGVLAFALNNAILVCILFVLMAAFWCLIMILIEKNARNKNEQISE